MSLPQRNATLTRVQAAAGGESYDGPAAAGAEKWAGAVDAYVRTKRKPYTGVEGRDVGSERSVTFAAADLAGVELLVGDVVTYQRTGASAPESVLVQDVVPSTIDDATIPPDLITTRLVLAPL